MSDILERFDFDDRPGLEKLKNLGDRINQLEDESKKFGQSFQQSIDRIDRVEKLEKSLIRVRNAISTVGNIAKNVAGAVTIAFGAATAASLKLAQQNELLSKQQDNLKESFGDFAFEMSRKFGPVIYAVQQTIIDLVGQASDGVKGLSKNFAVDLGSAVRAGGKVVVAFFEDFKKRANNQILLFHRLRLELQELATIDPLKKGALQASIEAINTQIEANKEGIQDLGEVYQTEFEKARTELSKLNFDQRKQNEDEIKRIQKVRSEYAKLIQQTQDRLNTLAIENAEGVKRIDLAEAFTDQEIDNLEKQALAFAQTEAEKAQAEEIFNKLRLETAKEFERQRTALALEEEEKRRKAIIASNKELFGDLAKLETAEDTVSLAFDDNLDQAVRSQVGQLQAAVERQDLSFLDKFKQELFSALGVDSEEGQFLIDSFSNLLGSLQSAFTANIDGQIEDNARLLESIRDRTNAVENELTREVALQAAGRENNVASKRRELEELKREEEKARKEREELLKKQRRAELLADAAQQASALAVSAANFFKSTSAIPGVGIALAISAIATMFSLMAKFRSQAKESSSADIKLYKGGALAKSGWINYRNGRSDVPGRGRGHRVEDSNLILGGREMVVAEGPAANQTEKFWQDLNAGKYNSVNLAKIVDMPNVKEINNTFRENHQSIVDHQRFMQESLTKDAIREVMKEHSKELINYFKKEFPHYYSIDDATRTIVKKSGKEEIITHIERAS